MLQPGLLLGVATNQSSSWNIKPQLILVHTLKLKWSQKVHIYRKCLLIKIIKQTQNQNVLALMQSLYLEDWKRCWSEIYRIKDKSGLEQTTIKIRSHGLRNSNTSRHDQGSNSNSPTSLPVPAWNWGLWIFYFQLRYYMYYTISMLEPSPNTRITGPWAVRFNYTCIAFPSQEHVFIHLVFI